MEKIKFYLEKYKLYLIVIILILLSLVVLYIIFNSKEKVEEKKEIVIEQKEEVKEEKISTLKVDVKGFVEKQGVYELDSESRVIDAINKAGGLKKEANTEYINLSKKLVDEMVIVIYSNDQIEKFKKEDKEIIYIEYECICPDNINDTCITQNDIVNTNGVKEEHEEKEHTTKEEENSDKETELISINTGEKEELMTLPGIGESKAENIIKYREENGNFEKLEDIMNVSGIGESAYSKIKEYIKL